MKFVSTRGQSSVANFGEAISLGLAPDGGLFVPEKFPKIDAPKAGAPLAAFGEKILEPFLEGVHFENSLKNICTSAFNFPAPVHKLNDTTSLLELFHGPTAAFKDFGARFLAQALTSLSDEVWTVLVATSGDTGGAVAGAFNNNPLAEVIVLYPKGLVSPLQEQQLTCWGANVHAYRVRGTFDDCQRMVKEAFLNQDWRKSKNLTSANSISLGRCLPQTIYYAKTSVDHFGLTKKPANFIVPTGNVGNALAALWAKKMGFPISKVVMACNKNRSVVDYFETGEIKPRQAIATLANAMDVGNPSNLERLKNLYPNIEDLKKVSQAYSVNNEEISETIRSVYSKHGYIPCPHTATGLFVREKYLSKDEHWIVAATAHPAKFESVVKLLINDDIPVPPSLERIRKLPSHYKEIDATLDALPRP